MTFEHRIAVIEHRDRYIVIPRDQFERARDAFEWCHKTIGPEGVDWCFRYNHLPWAMSFRHINRAIEFKLRFL